MLGAQHVWRCVVSPDDCMVTMLLEFGEIDTIFKVPLVLVLGLESKCPNPHAGGSFQLIKLTSSGQEQENHVLSELSTERSFWKETARGGGCSGWMPVFPPLSLAMG